MTRAREFRNEAPYASSWIAICLLHREWGDSSRRFLQNFPRKEPCVEIHHFSGPYDSLSSIVRFSVTQEVTDWLKRERLVIGEPKWGYRSTFTFEPTEELTTMFDNTIAPRFQARTWGR